MWQATWDLLSQTHQPVQLCRRPAENPEGTQYPPHPHYPAGHCLGSPNLGSSNNTHGYEGTSMAKKIIQRTKHTSPLHSRKGRSSTFGNLLLPFILLNLNLPYRHHSIWRLSKHHYTKSKEASSHTAHLHEHLCSDTGELWTNQSKMPKPEELQFKSRSL